MRECDLFVFLFVYNCRYSLQLPPYIHYLFPSCGGHNWPSLIRALHNTVCSSGPGAEGGWLVEDKCCDVTPICLAMSASSHPFQLHVRTLARDMEQVDNEGETRKEHNKASFLQRIFPPFSQASIIEVFRLIIFINPDSNIK